MAKYLWEATYTAQGIEGVLEEGGTGRRRAVEEVIESLGGRLEAFYYAFGNNDTYTIFELPDNISASAASLAIIAAGAVRVRTTVLLTPEEIDAAAEKSVQYRQPGR
ncbi:MAG TPA: GYD domain-containing protein [Egibacteraceae bacterium]|nr:GYD domain-containing protein [Actinomycetota bacterium]HWB72886.1 GYD domain-containing protein [Egibacteraceae bacterium]